MPRNRSARVAVLGSPAQRAAASSYSSRSSSALRRRIVMGVLVLLSLALITIYFRESAGGSLHGVQSAGATVLRPFEVGAERVARPFRDVYGYFTGLVHAKSENEKLRTEVDALRQQSIQNSTARQENDALRSQLHYVDGPRFPADYTPINARVMGRPPSEFQQQIVISAGTANGVVEHAPVVTSDGLVGQVSMAYGRVAQVTLITDADSAVAASDLGSGANGVLRHGQGAGSLILDFVPKESVVKPGDIIVTAGSPSGSKLPSLYPRGIQIGRVSSVNQNDTDLYKQVQVEPFVGFGSLDSVAVLKSSGQ